MIGTAKPRIVMGHKEALIRSSLNFAESSVPDFIIMKEAIALFEKILLA